MRRAGAALCSPRAARSRPRFRAEPAFPAATSVQPIVGWRDFFADPKLRLVIDQALTNNRDLRIAAANIAAARAQYQVQRSNQLPHLDAGLGATLAQQPAAVAGVPGAGAFNEHIFTANIGVNAFQLDLFGKLRDLSRAAQENYFANRSARDAAQISLVQAVAAAYVTLGRRSLAAARRRGRRLSAAAAAWS